MVVVEMWLAGGGVGGGGIAKTLVRYFSRKCAVNLRKINPKVPTQEANSIAEGLYHVIKQHGPLSVSNTWIHAKVGYAPLFPLSISISILFFFLSEYRFLFSAEY